MMYSVRFVFIFFLYFGMVLESKAFNIQCPESIKENLSVKDSPADWEVIEGPGEHTLDQVSIYLSHPRQKGTQVPDNVKRTKNEESVTWRIIRGQSDEYWVGCSYHDTTAILARKLNNRISQCVASYEISQTGQRLRLKKAFCN